MEDYEEIYDFLSYGTYPTGFSKNQKRALRRKRNDHFKVLCSCKQLLYQFWLNDYAGGESLLMYSRNVSGKQRQWRQVPRSVKEIGRILEIIQPIISLTRKK